MFVFLGDDGDEGIDGLDGDVGAPGIAPDDGTDGGAGDDGEGLIGHLLDQSDVLSGDLEVQAEGGWGGDGGNGGLGGSAPTGVAFNGANGGNSGYGGAGGDVNIGIDDVIADTVSVLVVAGYGGDGGGWNSTNLFGNGGKAAEDGYNGGNGGNGGHGGVGGSTSLTLADSEAGATFIQISAGDGGEGGDGGDGGEGASVGGTGGNGGLGGHGGNGGGAALSVIDNLFVTSDGRAIAATGGKGGDGGFQGYAGTGTAGDGSYGNNGNGGEGGDASVAVTGNTFDFTSDCGCEDGIVIAVVGGQGGFGYASEDDPSQDGVSGSGGDAVFDFSGNHLRATIDDVVISLALFLNAGQGGVFLPDPTDTTAGVKGADGTTDLIFGNNTIEGSAGIDTFQLEVDNFIYDDADTGVGITPLGSVIIDLTDGVIDLGSGATSVIADIEHIDVIIRDGYFDSNDDFHDSGVAVYLRGNAAANDLGSSEGDDELKGEAGNDTLNGYGGDDTVIGGLGDDVLYVDSDFDVVVELDGEGKDMVVSTITWSLVGTFIEDLYLDGFDDVDGTGNDGANRLTGSAGNNRLDGGVGADSMYGGDGDDTYYVDDLGDRIYEDAGMGRDVVISWVSLSLVGRVVEQLYLIGSDNLNATGNTLANTIDGNDGHNVIDGGENYDKMYGGLGNDTYYVDHVDDKVYEFLNAGTDVIYTSVEYDLTGRHIEVAYLTGSADMALFGNSLANALHGNDGGNLLDGRAGNDSLWGGLGDDTYGVNASGDVVTELDGEGTDTVESSRSYALGDFVENLFLTGASDINGTGNGLNNALVGNEGHNVLTGGLGDDSYYVQAGNDVVVEAAGEGNDEVHSSVSFLLWGTYVEGLVLTGTANIDATGNNQVNSLFGNDGNNVIDGGGAGDLLWGGLGADTFLFQAGCRADSIYDFDASEGDVIDLSAFGSGTISQAGSHALIDLGSGNLVWVRDTDATDAGFLGAIIW
ncbi:hemolysin-type calcium-binding repeat 2 copies family protein [Asticcacaulis biprosthecium C19]|uniref:Hemolysin-type calcium-binding repeat 2 copies family protein n=1 Tax=Asticcacaulis biprosthecium C19 TaxID=715226 RepID=F4QHV1_9CAUL|nr:calcium-binding protein [Asticcacaulis biprosthecium]EGF92838.1 hemolysin-type calcium-binding repeat 2 copies family protein [Asticcacaulis biprosthecium C19]